MQNQPQRTTAHRARWWITALAIAVMAVGPAASASAAPAANPVSFRMAHFSADTPPVDLYLTGSDSPERVVLKALAYGEVSEYLQLAPGKYGIALRPAGASPSSPATLVASAELAEGGAYTFAAFGPRRTLRQQLLSDDLTPPPPGQARVRLIEAAPGKGFAVQVENGPVLTPRADFASSTGYAPVPVGTWRLQVTELGKKTPTTVGSLDLAAGTVNSLIVLRKGGKGAVQIKRVVDAAGVAANRPGQSPTGAGAPAGGVQTGGGGTAPMPLDGGQEAVWAAAAMVLVALMVPVRRVALRYAEQRA